MAELNPPSYLSEGCHTAQTDRLVWTSLVCSEGVALSNGNGLRVRVTTPTSMSVEVMNGSAFISGDNIAHQGMYHVYNDGLVTLTHDPADATDDRIDRVIARVKDAQYAGTENEWELVILKGTPSPAPVAPVVPSNSISLATVRIDNASTTVEANDITDTREAYDLCTSGLPNSGLIAHVVYTSNGTFEKADYPDGKNVYVQAVGGGGAGGGARITGAGESSVGEGGGGGHYAASRLAFSALGDSINVTVGNGGPGIIGTGSTGGSSSFGSHVTAEGGEGGTDSGGAGSTAATSGGPANPISSATAGQLRIHGGAGGFSLRQIEPTMSQSGAGGDSQLGRGGRPAVSQGVGAAGRSFGGGGGGAKNGANAGSGLAGGDGGQGVVIVMVFG